jgi:hypothetical protein
MHEDAGAGAQGRFLTVRVSQVEFERNSDGMRVRYSLAGIWVRRVESSQLFAELCSPKSEVMTSLINLFAENTSKNSS